MCSNSPCIRSDHPVDGYRGAPLRYIFEAMETEKGLTIPARVRTSDCAMYAQFDARSWFRIARVEDVVELARNDWRGEHLAEEIVSCAADTNPAVADLLQYVMHLRHGGEYAGCRCFVDRVSAQEWLAYNRPDVLSKLRSSGSDFPKVA